MLPTFLHARAHQPHLHFPLFTCVLVEKKKTGDFYAAKIVSRGGQSGWRTDYDWARPSVVCDTLERMSRDELFIEMSQTKQKKKATSFLLEKLA